MKLESILSYFTHHVESIIQWLFLLILALSGYVISRGLFGKKETGTDNGPSVNLGPEVQGTLQKILEQTAKLEGVSVSAPAGGGEASAASAGGGGASPADLEKLKKELAQREEELKAIKAAGGDAGGKASADLTARLKELEAKLAEYEILEDDIADLSLYKEENIRLKQELDKLKKGGAAPAAEPDAAAEPASAEESVAEAAPAAEAAPESVPEAAEPAPAPDPSEDIVAEFAQAVSQEVDVPPPPAPAPEVTMRVPDTGNPMEDFEAAVQIEKQKNPAKAAAPAVEAPAAPAPAAAAPAPAAPTPPAAPAAAAAAAAPAPTADSGEKKESDDIFAEFSEESAGATGELDTDKMMAEMAALVNLDPTDGSGLEEGVDTDKMAAEANKLAKGG
ncbi:MAG: hypothetical protein AB7F86_15310 [Bdellovibrionales bacterium]